MPTNMGINEMTIASFALSANAGAGHVRIPAISRIR